MSSLPLRRRLGVIAAALCFVSGAGGVLALQAAASGPGAPSPVRVTPGIRLSVQPRTASGAAHPFITATNASCGESVTTSLTLNGDLDCSGYDAALTITNPSVTLNLNGHEITDNGGNSATGVLIESSSDTVENGVVTGFGVGVLIRRTSMSTPPNLDTVTKIRATYNGQGIENHAGSNAKITSNIVYGNSGDGVYDLAGYIDTVSNNIATSNGAYGIEISQSASVTVSGNQADSNQINGIVSHYGLNTTITGNTANFNLYDGIANGETNAIDGGRNLAKGNDYATGAPPEQCAAIACN